MVKFQVNGFEGENEGMFKFIVNNGAFLEEVLEVDRNFFNFKNKTLENINEMQLQSFSIGIHHLDIRGLYLRKIESIEGNNLVIKPGNNTRGDVGIEFRNLMIFCL